MAHAKRGEKRAVQRRVEEGLGEYAWKDESAQTKGRIGEYDVRVSGGLREGGKKVLRQKRWIGGIEWRGRVQPAGP